MAPRNDPAGRMKVPALSRTAESILIVAAYALPLAVAPMLIPDAAGMPKTIALVVTTALLIGTGLARLILHGEPVAPATPVTLPACVFAGWCALTALHTGAPAESVLALIYLGALLTAMLLASDLPHREPVINAMLIAGSLAGLYGIGQYLGFEPLPWASHFRPRVFSTLGNPVFLGGDMAALFPLTLARWLYTEQEETKDLLTLLLAVLALTAYLTWTRSAWLALVVATAVQFGWLFADARGRALVSANRTWLLTVGVVGLIVAVGVSTSSAIGAAPVPVADRLADAVNPRGYSARFRLANAEVCGRIARESPVLGCGIGGYFSRYPWLRLVTRAARGQFFASQEMYAHNDHLQILAETGVPGLGLWLWFLVCAVRWTWSKFRGGDWLGLGAAGCLAAVATDGVLNFPLHIPATGWVLAVALGLVAARDPGPGDERAAAPSASGGWTRRIAAIALVTGCGLATIRPCWRLITADRRTGEGDQQVGSNNYEMAAVYYGAGVETSPLDRFLNFRYAVAAATAGRYEWLGNALDDSMLHVKRALALGYHDENVYKHLSDLYARKTAMPQAIRALDLAWQLDPQRQDIANNLSYYLALSGTRLDDAIALARGAVAEVPEDATYLDTLGFALGRAGRRSEAAAVLRHALRNLPVLPGNYDRSMARQEVLDYLRLAGASP